MFAGLRAVSLNEWQENAPYTQGPSKEKLACMRREEVGSSGNLSADAIREEKYARIIW